MKSPRTKSRHAHNKKATSYLRIIGGQWRSRKLTIPDLPGLRPTTDRVRETLFNWLMQTIPGAYCLDAYSGTGALGLESLSRGAKFVQFIEASSVAAQQLSQHLSQLQVPGDDANITNTDAVKWLSQPSDQQFDVVFLDPPFHQGLLNQTCQLLETGNWLAADAYIYVEAEQDLTTLQVPACWQIHRQKQAGQVCFYLFKRHLTES
ncbi:16S rRNA (guanine(966)-N(2))-methyltransferase RsmD [Endozoicomonas sp. SM1973]|uniref:Ribosomal RNA small subunit methyltransferase D n=1 Tax=Spartinivicinus marinus TaxID=2994442 RepID=A0A853IHG4_9GAMM|nr:16S rRNA (guanine(966)-N(2))-methyltransferase RsmD [Spartinivicinus marinus]MCX4027096.1 16S rRNA (guanine(966)-N(2))-methyltransferase RsmD [Spartinivicinus marinus]NYZ68575.1 16S rRNA (guanine(966)-N(2))-methyltransferase RsmD [Spartinivicinus marinus]